MGDAESWTKKANDVMEIVESSNLNQAGCEAVLDTVLAMANAAIRGDEAVANAGHRETLDGRTIQEWRDAAEESAAMIDEYSAPRPQSIAGLDAQGWKDVAAQRMKEKTDVEKLLNAKRAHVEELVAEQNAARKKLKASKNMVVFLMDTIQTINRLEGKD